jgi:hypothetical protein
MGGTIAPLLHMTSWHVKENNLTLYYTDAKESTTQNNTSTNDYIHVSIADLIPRFSYVPVMVEKCAI